MNKNEDIKKMRLTGTMTEGKDIEPTPSDAAETSVEHCIITFRKGLSPYSYSG